MSLDQAIANTRAHLLSLRNKRGHWEGELSSSALSTATAVVALSLVDAEQHAALIDGGARWLARHQNADGGWGDTTISKSNLSTTLLCWSALTLVDKHRACLCPHDITSNGVPHLPLGVVFARCELWIRERVGSLEPDAICKAVVARYGKDKTFSVPILMTCALGGRLGEHDKAWRRVLALPFELAALPRAWFGAVGLPVVSYALPALIAIGHARFHHAPPSVLNPLRWLRALLWPRISPMLKALQPSTGGYLEATPLTSFVTMALAGSDQHDHPCVSGAVAFLRSSQREDGSWPIDTNLSTWGTTLAVKACSSGFSPTPQNGLKPGLQTWLLDQQYKTIHPFTNAAPGGWAWTDLPGGVPDADDTSGALIALSLLDESLEERVQIIPAIEPGITWLLDLQNRDGGVPTFCRGWGTLPFDRSTPELTAHALLSWWLWRDEMPGSMQARIRSSTGRALAYLKKSQRADGSWIPLWFGNEHAMDEENPVYGTAQVVAYLCGCESLAAKSHELVKPGVRFLLRAQKSDGSWGGDANAPSSIEETAVALHAVAEAAKASATDALGAPVGSGLSIETLASSATSAAAWLIAATQHGTHFPPAPVGLYFARLWYHEQLYPVVWTLEALSAASELEKIAAQG